MEDTGEFPFLSFKNNVYLFFRNFIHVCGSFWSSSPLLPIIPPSRSLPRPNTSTSYFNFSYYLFLFSYLRQGTTLLPKLVSNSWTPWILLPPDSWECKSLPLYSSPRSIFLVMKYKTFKVRQSKSLPFLVRLFLRKNILVSLLCPRYLKLPS